MASRGRGAEVAVPYPAQIGESPWLTGTPGLIQVNLKWRKKF